jgi:ribonuclease HIII
LPNRGSVVDRPTIGLDETGKGDYFGPLVVAAVCGKPEALRALGVADSKKVADTRCTRLAREIREAFEAETVVIQPVRYNELYGRMKNLNKLLAWAHARALENLLERVDASLVVADQFANPHVLQSALLDKGRTVDLKQMHRAESHPSVAAASIVARAEFLERLEQLGSEFGLTLPKGAGAPVDAAGIQIVRSGGVDLLRKVAKLHFKTTQKIGVSASQLA